MKETVKEMLMRIANPFIFGNIIIALCTLSLVQETYLLLNAGLRWDSLSGLTFFATLLLYNFHRLMGVRKIKPEDHGMITGWAAKNQFTLLIFALIGAGGVAFFIFQVSTTILFLLFVLGGIAALYEFPIVKYHKSFLKLRNMWLTKIFMITGVWSFTTVLLPALNAGFSFSNYHVWLVLAERMLFIFILALCFDMRDLEFDRRDNLKTIPIIYGDKKVREFYKIFSVLFFILIFIHYVLIQHYWGTGVALTASAIVTYLSVYKTFPRKSDYYYLFVVDGMMIVQFFLVWILGWIK